jgi:predicted acylesterase/phospholipase RssA
MTTKAEKSAAEYLGGIPLYSGLGEAERTRLASRAAWVELEAGGWLFRAGEPGDALFVLCSGRVEALAPEGADLPSREIGRGEAVGELAILTGAPRSASVRAKRDSLLLRVGREEFRDLLDEPGFAASLLGALGERLRGSWSRQTPAPEPPRVIAVAALDGAPPAAALADSLRARLAVFSAVSVLSEEAGGADRAAFAAALDARERLGERVLLLVGDVLQQGPWDRFALEQADRTLIASGCGAKPPSPESLGGCDLLICGRGSAAPEWLESLSPRSTHRFGPVAGGEHEAMGRLARRLSGRSLGIVLSGGGARGLAHIGALSVLQEEGVVFDRVSGSSMGAIVGALFARGLNAGEVAEICREELVRRNPLNDYTVPLVALARRKKAAAMLRRMFGEGRVEDLPLSYSCVSTDMVSGELVTHRSGPLLEAVGASACLPVLLPPYPSGERLLVDGGVLNNLPVRQLAAAGEGPVIAIDVTARYEPRRRSTRRSRAGALRARVRGALTGEPAVLPSLGETVTRMIALGSVDTSEEARAHADLVIEPGVAGIGLTAFDQAERIIESGRTAAEALLEEIRRLG